MQAATGTLTAAVTGQERDPQAQLLVDWDNDGTFSQAIDDQSARVESIQIDRTLTTDLPDAVDLLAGYETATATVTLSGDPTDETKTATWYYSPYSTGSPIYGKRRRWRTALLALGFQGTAGTELLPAMTGKTRNVSSNGAGKTASIELFDNAETMRGSIDLPLVIADDKRVTGSFRPGLNASWVIDYIARTFGYYAAPPRRTGCAFEASFAGSAYPALGTMSSVRLGSGLQVAFVPGKFIQAAASSDPATQSLVLDYTLAGALSTNNGGEVLIDGWANVAAGVANGVCEITSTLGSGTANKVTLTVDSTAHLQVSIRRTNGGAITTYGSGLTVPTGQLAYLAAHVYMTSTTITIQWRVNGTTATTSQATSSVTGQPTLTGVSFDVAENSAGFQGGSGLGYEAWQVSNPAITTGTPTWNDAYVGNSVIQPSLNTLTAVVPGAAAGWDLVQQIAAAELATVAFDETGQFTFYTRNRWTSPPYTTAQRTIDASSLKDLTVTEAVDQVRNHVRATASPAAVQNAGYIWQAAEVMRVRASHSINVLAQLDQAATNIDTSVVLSLANNPNGSFYRANTKADGSGTTSTLIVNATVVDGGTAVHLVITNPIGTDAYLVNPPGFTDAQGTPALALWGQTVLYAQSPVPDSTTVAVTAPTQTVSDVSDATSIAQHGEQLLEIPVNPWLQNGASLDALVADLLARLKDPPPVVTGLSIPYDPRLQLGDRIHLIADPFGLAADFFLIGSHVTFNVGGGANQNLDTRAV